MTASGSPARSLARENIECRVLDPASIQVNRRARRVKTDRIEVLMLLRALIAIDRGERHVCAVVRVPSIEEEDARRSHRERQRLVRERTGHINRIKGLLFAQGIRGIEPKLRSTRIDFSALTTAEGHPLPDRLRRELAREYARLELIQNQIRDIDNERDAADAQEPAVEMKRQMLIALQGIGGAGAAILSARGFRPHLRQPATARLLSWPDAQRLRQRLNDALPGNLKGRQRVGETRADRDRLALAQIPAGKSAFALVCCQDAGAVAAYSAHHADCSCPQTRHHAVALCRNRRRPPGRDREQRGLTET